MKGFKVSAALPSELNGEPEHIGEGEQHGDVEPFPENVQAEGSGLFEEGELSHLNEPLEDPEMTKEGDPLRLCDSSKAGALKLDLAQRKESRALKKPASPTALKSKKDLIEAEDFELWRAPAKKRDSGQNHSLSKPPELPRIRASAARPKFRQTLRSLLKHTTPAMPGFGLTLGITLFWLGALVLIPLSALLLGAGALGFSGFWEQVSSAQSLAAFRLSLGTAFLAALINAVFGLLLAWVLVRQPFRGKALIDALIDLPFALPTAVAGIALSSLWSKKGLLGAPVAAFGFEVAFAAPGIVLALVFVGLPFVVRSVQPVLEGLDPRLEEAAVVLGAGHFHTFRRVVFPLLFPALLSGFSLSFARGLGEYGSVIFIAGNLPLKSEILPVLIVSRLENFDHAGATALGAAMLAVSFAALLVFNLLQVWLRRGWGKA